MKKALIVFFLLYYVSVNAQYYYRDIVLPAKNSELWQAYKTNGIKKVVLASQEADGSLTEGFSGDQIISRDYSTIITHTVTLNAGESILVSNYSPEGKITKMVDSSDGYRTETSYQYDQFGKLASQESQTFIEGKPGEVEKHQWIYDEKGKPVRMHRIKNGTDETVVSFVQDEQGNVGEENSFRGGTALPSVYYYYDNVNRLTDIVRYSRQAKRLLPDYMFEYDLKGKVTSMIVVPEGSDEYQRWVYEYQANTLKKSETCFDKRKKLLGRIEYTYSN
ncbi:MAG TPA: hypothetical protein VLC28_10035 [Flavitalea sp.]|nr:hypothetical protein [Flavitalea sp.]